MKKFTLFLAMMIAMVGIATAQTVSGHQSIKKHHRHARHAKHHVHHKHGHVAKKRF